VELLHSWAISDYGFKVYHRLLELLQHPLPPEELMLHLEALVLLCKMSARTECDDMEPPQRVCLVDLDHLLRAYISIHKSQAILREMVWSFSRAILSAMSPDSQDPYLRFLGPAQTAFSTLGQSPDIDLDRYFKERLRDSSSHADTYARIQNNARSVPAPVRCTLKHGDKVEDEFRLEHGDHAGETGSSRLRWILNVLGFGSCGGRKVRR